MSLFDTINSGGTQLLGVAWPTVWALVRILVVAVVILLCVAYLILWERKLIGWMHVRLGPNRVGPAGLLQPIADVLKLLLKEVIQPAQASRWIYMIAPIMVVVPAFAVWAVIPFRLARCSATSTRVSCTRSRFRRRRVRRDSGRLGVELEVRVPRCDARGRSNGLVRNFDGLRPRRRADDSGSLNLSDIVTSQERGIFAGYGLNFLSWNWLPLLPMFVVYFISGIAETNRHPFDVVEGESEIVAGHMIDYSGMAFALFFLAEYINMIVISALAATLFLGGWSAPFGFLSFVPGIVWLVAKVFFLLSVFIWARATFPRYRYDQIMRLGWKIFIPVCVVWLIVVGFWIMSPLNIWK
jgi:NADH:ubiquinone oxidoreductase subunit 1 (chain H)